MKSRPFTTTLLKTFGEKGCTKITTAQEREKIKVLFTCLQVRDHRGARGDRGAHWHVHTGPFVVHPSRDTVGLQVHEPPQLLQVSGVGL